MATEIRVPTLGESVSEATIGKWFKKIGDAVAADEPLLELETDKVTVEVPSPAAGVLAEIAAKDGETVGVGALLGSVDSAGGAKPAKKERSGGAGDQARGGRTGGRRGGRVDRQGSRSQDRQDRRRRPDRRAQDAAGAGSRQAARGEQYRGRSGPGFRQARPGAEGRRHRGRRIRPHDAAVAAASVSFAPAAPATAVAARAPSSAGDESREERVRMTKLRQTIARRLKEAQSTAAMLTTFNEVDMSAVMEIRTSYKDVFEKKHGVKLGFMGFFTKAVTHALKEIPAVNAEIDGTDIIYKNYAHIGVAVGTEKGLVVPVVRNADQMSIAEIEKEIGRLGLAARDGKLGVADMQGGTFTISNGGVYGSLMSTPILNAPQSGILGMHKIQERPVVVGGQIVIRPMMYLALSYDHRIVDGKEAVTFLVRVKESLEDPARLVLDL